jgi:hypothetical protein
MLCATTPLHIEIFLDTRVYQFGSDVCTEFHGRQSRIKGIRKLIPGPTLSADAWKRVIRRLLHLNDDIDTLFVLEWFQIYVLSLPVHLYQL